MQGLLKIQVIKIERMPSSVPFIFEPLLFDVDRKSIVTFNCNKYMMDLDNEINSKLS